MFGILYKLYNKNGAFPHIFNIIHSVCDFEYT